MPVPTPQHAGLDAKATTEPSDAAPPPGFERLNFGGSFMRHVGPLFLHEDAAGARLGFRVQPQHVNPAGHCHGGMLAAFCDTLLLVVAHRSQPDPDAVFFPTIGLQIDYLAGAPLGAWVEGEAQILRMARTTAFIQGLVRADDQLCVRTSGVFKRMAGPARG